MMKMRIIISAIISAIFVTDSDAQTTITNLHNGYRDGDELYRIVTEYAQPGERGENCVWKLPHTKKNDEFLRQTVSLKNDSLTISEGEYLIHYIATDKEVSMRGFQNRNICSVQSNLSTEMKYPFAYGDSISDTYSRKTSYYDMFAVKGEGTCYTVCDGWGVLTDGEEMLKDVLRIHHHSTIVSKHDSFDGDRMEPVTSEVTEDKYLWYYPGCRYPVMDTRIVCCKTNGKIVSDTTFTSLYMPELQMSELAYDDANSQLIAAKEGAGNSDEENGSNENGAAFPVKTAASHSANPMEIQLDYQVSEDTDAAFYAHDITGKLLGSIRHVSLSKGEYHETITLNRRPINDIVMLTIIAGNMQEVVKVR